MSLRKTCLAHLQDPTPCYLLKDITPSIIPSHILSLKLGHSHHQYNSHAIQYDPSKIKPWWLLSKLQLHFYAALTGKLLGACKTWLFPVSLLPFFFSLSHHYFALPLFLTFKNSDNKKKNFKEQTLYIFYLNVFIVYNNISPYLLYFSLSLHTYTLIYTYFLYLRD